MLYPQNDDRFVTIDSVTSLHLMYNERNVYGRSTVHARNGLITIAIRARFEYDSTTIRLQHATTRYEVFRSLAYEIVYENQW